jgi:hypothetical protein
LDTVELGVLPFSAPLKIPPASGFWIYGGQQVVVETWHAEMWLDDADSVATHMKVWRTLRESAVYGADALRVIGAAQQDLHRA